MDVFLPNRFHKWHLALKMMLWKNFISEKFERKKIIFFCRSEQAWTPTGANSQVTLVMLSCYCAKRSMCNICNMCNMCNMYNMCKHVQHVQHVQTCANMLLLLRNKIYVQTVSAAEWDSAFTNLTLIDPYILTLPTLYHTTQWYKIACLYPILSYVYTIPYVPYYTMLA